MPLPRILLPLALLMVGALLVSQGLVALRLDYAVGAAFAVAVFMFVFVKSEAGLYLVLFSMLLSPEFGVSGGALAERRAVVIRLEDVLLIAIALSWFAKTAVNKELGLVAKTPLNRPILGYTVVTALATVVGYLTGTVKSAGGFFYVLKYIEYFVVYYITVNNLRDRPQARRLVTTALLTAAVVSVIGVAQIPSGHRVSAPFEGEVGEPNTFGGYLLFMMAIAAGIALESQRLRIRAAALGLLGLMVVPFMFTLSRTSYLGMIPLVLVLAVFSSRRKAVVALLALAVVASPLWGPLLLPEPVVNRILYTFQPEERAPTVTVGRVAFDPSTSERLISFRAAILGWAERPILGHGVTGFGFMDAQYARTLVETGVVGLVAFLALLWGALKSGFASYRGLQDPEERGLALGFVAGTVGLMFHAIGANSFIIVRIMEPFWFFAGVVVVLPMLQTAGAPAPARAPAQALGYQT